MFFASVRCRLGVHEVHGTCAEQRDSGAHGAPYAGAVASEVSTQDSDLRSRAGWKSPVSVPFGAATDVLRESTDGPKCLVDRWLRAMNRHWGTCLKPVVAPPLLGDKGLDSLRHSSDIIPYPRLPTWFAHILRGG